MKKLTLVFAILFSLNIMANGMSPPITTNADEDYSTTANPGAIAITAVAEEMTLTNTIRETANEAVLVTDYAIVARSEVLRSDFVYTIERNLTIEPQADRTLQFLQVLLTLILPQESSS